MEYLPINKPTQELPSSWLQTIKSLIRKHKTLCFFVLLNVSGCAHNPVLNIKEPAPVKTNIIPSSETQVNENAQVNENIEKNNPPNQKPKCNTIRVVPCDWIQQKCSDGTKPVT